MSPSSTVYRTCRVWSTSKWKPCQSCTACGILGSGEPAPRGLAHRVRTRHPLHLVERDDRVGGSEVVPAVLRPGEPVVEVDEPALEQPHEATRRTRRQVGERRGVGAGPRVAFEQVRRRERGPRPVGAGRLDREPLAEPAGGAHRRAVPLDGLAVLDQLDHDARARPRGTDGAADHDVIEQPDLSHPSGEHGADLDRHGFARRRRRAPRRRCRIPGGWISTENAAGRVGGGRGDRSTRAVPDLDRRARRGAGRRSGERNPLTELDLPGVGRQRQRRLRGAPEPRGAARRQPRQAARRTSSTSSHPFAVDERPHHRVVSRPVRHHPEGVAVEDHEVGGPAGRKGTALARDRAPPPRSRSPRRAPRAAGARRANTRSRSPRASRPPARSPG